MFKQMFFGVVFAGASSLAMADMKPHMYLAGSVGSVDFDTDGGGSMSDTSISVNAGYYINQNFSAELGYTDLGGEYGVSASVISIAAKGSYPLTEAFSVYGRVGLGFGSLDADNIESQSNTDVFYGVGAAFRVAESVDLTAGYDMFTVGDDVDVDVSVIAVGVAVHF